MLLNSLTYNPVPLLLTSAIHLAQNVEPGTPNWIYLDLSSMADLDTLYQEYQTSGARVIEAPTDKEWNMREMLVADLDGHTLRIGVPLPEAEAED